MDLSMSTSWLSMYIAIKLAGGTFTFFPGPFHPPDGLTQGWADFCGCVPVECIDCIGMLRKNVRDRPGMRLKKSSDNVPVVSSSGAVTSILMAKGFLRE